MKLSTILKPLVFFCFVLSMQSNAQNQIPSEERVEELLQQIDNCKSLVTQTENNIKKMEDNPGSYTLAEYNAAKEFLDRVKTCLNTSRGELDSIRKEYPGWFNSPSATMPLGRGKEVTPRSLEEELSAIGKKIKAALKALDAIDEPHD